MPSAGLQLALYVRYAATFRERSTETDGASNSAKTVWEGNLIAADLFGQLFPTSRSPEFIWSSSGFIRNSLPSVVITPTELDR